MVFGMCPGPTNGCCGLIEGSYFIRFQPRAQVCLLRARVRFNSSFHEALAILGIRIRFI
jgi:hypothetical protein